MRQAFGRGFYFGGVLAGAMTATKGKFPPGDMRTERDAEQEIIRTRRSRRYPAPDGKLTFDKLSSVYLSGNRTRDDAPNHLRVQTRVPEEIAVIGCDDLPAAAYDAVPLTTLAQPAEEAGARLAELLLEGLKDSAGIADTRLALPMRLVVRRSCGGAPA